MICSDTETFSGSVDAFEITKMRLEKGLWPLFKGTKNRSVIKPRDLCLFYLAGKGKLRQHIIATANIKDVVDWSYKKGAVDDEEIMSDFPEKVLLLEEIKSLIPIPIRPLVNHLDFISSSGHSWGGSLQGGCRKLGNKDVQQILLYK